MDKYKKLRKQSAGRIYWQLVERYNSVPCVWEVLRIQQLSRFSSEKK